MKTLYQKIEPYNEFELNVSNLHTIHVEESGNPNGKPIIFLHGGPGGGIEPITANTSILINGELSFLISEAVEKALPMPNFRKIPLGI